MKAVMLSIRPEWCEKIVSGRKRMELRKTKPKLELPFKCYIYCTKGFPMLWKDGKKVFIADSKYEWLHFTPDPLNGRVIGEFVCDAILSRCEMANADLAEQVALVRREEILKYSNGKEVFGWHISQLQIYDTPKELSEFLVEDNRTFDCPGIVAMKRPPQSWCYVEGMG